MQMCCDYVREANSSLHAFALARTAPTYTEHRNFEQGRASGAGQGSQAQHVEPQCVLTVAEWTQNPSPPPIEHYTTTTTTAAANTTTTPYARWPQLKQFPERGAPYIVERFCFYWSGER